MSEDNNSNNTQQQSNDANQAKVVPEKPEGLKMRILNENFSFDITKKKKEAED